MWASVAAEVHSVGPWHLQYSPQCPGTQKASGRGVHVWPWGLRAVPLSSWAGWALVTCLSALSLSFPCGMSRCPPSLGSQKGHPGWLLLSLLSHSAAPCPTPPGESVCPACSVSAGLRGTGGSCTVGGAQAGFGVYGPSRMHLGDPHPVWSAPVQPSTAPLPVPALTLVLTLKHCVRTGG